MANPIQPCTCSPYQNICCCGPQNGISVTQPKCQTLPDGSIVNNPAYSLDLNLSFWTYKFITDCGGPATKAISNFGIPVCQLISADHITVYEKIDGCGEFVSVPFELKTTDPNLGTPPAGYKWLKVETNGRYGIGVSVEYRIAISGDFPVDTQPIKVKAGTPVLTFDCGCFLVPKCNPEGKLSITKECSHTIINNQATLQYSLSVSNTGSGSLAEVLFKDVIIIPTQLSLGPVSVTPATLSVSTATPGQIIITGNIGPIDPGNTVAISYKIPIAAVTEPGKYVISNTANVSGLNTQASASCITNLNVVRLSANKCCTIDGDGASYTLTLTSVGNSPDIVVDLYDRMTVPSGITVKFLNLSGCEGYYAGTSTPVPTNTPIPGPAAFDFICRNALVPAGGSYTKIGSYVLLSSSVVGTSTIGNSIINVVPVDETAQIFLGTANLPATALIDVVLSQVCNNPCSAIKYAGADCGC